MKTKLFTLLTAAVWLLQTSAHAQIRRGNIMVGGNISNMKLGLNEGGAFELNLNPKAAWFIRNNLALGAYVDLGLMAAKATKPSTSYGVGALGRYYINDPMVNVHHKVRFFAEATAGFEGYNPSWGDNTNGLGITIGPGITYFVTPSIGLEALAKYRGIVGFGSTPAVSNLLFGIGFQIYLPGGQVDRELQRKTN